MHKDMVLRPQVPSVKSSFIGEAVLQGTLWLCLDFFLFYLKEENVTRSCTFILQAPRARNHPGGHWKIKELKLEKHKLLVPKMVG